MIVTLLKLDGTPAPDAADALAAALCHGNQRRMHTQLGTGKRIAGAG
jgi:crossover junction endodeoxyribonuclease RuvC